MYRDDLRKRMTTYYENVSKTKLMRRTPVAIRIDGKAFHTFTKGFKVPFDEVLIKSMQDTMKYLCENIQGCVLGYTQSDEITLILVDYQTLNTSAWFNYRVDKLCSISAGMATMAFNRAFTNHVYTIMNYLHTLEEPDKMLLQKDYNICDADLELGSEFWNRLKRYEEKMGTAIFDARCCNIPKEEVCNLIYWRQLDASINSVQMVGRANFTDEELKKKSCNAIQDMLMTQKGINWNNFPTYQKRGSCCVRNKLVVESDGAMEMAQLRDTSKSENEWIIDKDIPIFKGNNRNYIDRLIYVGN